MRPTDYPLNPEWRAALAAMRQAEAPRPAGVRCTASAAVVVDSMHGTAVVRENRDALRRARKEART